jgi:hypothetical protein
VRQDPTDTWLKNLPEAHLKDLYLKCSGAATRHLLGTPEIAMCSMTYQALLTRVFGGDFSALLNWSRLNPDNAVD